MSVGMRDIYSLPSDSFIAGQTRKYTWHLYKENGNPFEVSNHEGIFTVTDYSQRSGTPPISKAVEFSNGDSGITNVVSVELAPQDTINLDGKYIYQLSLRDKTDKTVEIPSQGILYITNNIDKDFINNNNEGE